MRRNVLILLLCIFSANVMYAQTDTRRLNRGLEDAVEKAVREHEAKQKKAIEEARRKEREKAQRHEQQRRQHEAQFNRQMDNLNSVSAEDYMTGPKQQTGEKGLQATTYRAEENAKTPVATPRNNPNSRQSSNIISNSANRNNYGTPSYSGLNYSGDRYDLKRAGFENTRQQPKARKPASEYRSQYTSRQPKSNSNNKTITTIQHQQTPTRVSVQPLKQQKKQQISNGQAKQQPPIQQKVAWVENGKIVLDTSKPINMKPQSSSSTDLKKVDTRKIDYATKIHNTTVYNLPEEAYNLSDRDNKRVSTNVKQRANDDRTESEQYKRMKEDLANGFSSFGNRKKWENIYDYGYHKTVTTSRTVTKKRY